MHLIAHYAVYESLTVWPDSSNSQIAVLCYGSIILGSETIKLKTVF